MGEMGKYAILASFGSVKFIKKEILILQNVSKDTSDLFEKGLFRLESLYYLRTEETNG